MQESIAPVFLGRDAEIETLAALADRVAAGQGAVVLVEGEPGIGKSSLLEMARVRFTAAGLHVQLGGAKEPQQDVPFAAVRSWLDADSAAAKPRSDPIRELLRGGNRVGDVAATHEIAVAEAILDRIDAWCAAGPVALIMDDVHWADTSSLSVLHRLCALLDHMPLLVLLAARPLPRGRAFTALSAELVERRAPMVRLGALPDAAVAELVRHMVGAPPAPSLLREVGSAGGNPLYLTELVAALMREQAITVVSDVAVPTGTAAGERPSASLAEAISRRLGFLSRRTRDVLPMAAALGPAVDVSELAAVLNSPILEIWTAVTEATDGGLLTVVNSELVFRHDLIRRVLADQLPASLRSGLLRRAGRVLQSTDAPIERVAYFLAVGDHELDKPSIAWLVAVADELVIRAPELAVQLFGRAATATQFDGAQYSVLIRLHIRALLWHGRAADAEAAARAALSKRPAHDDVELRWLRAQACQAQGRVTDAVEIAETALTTLDLSIEDAGRFQGMCAVHNIFLERLEAAERAGRQAVAMGESTGNPLTTAYGLTALGAVRYTRGDLDEALELSTRIPILLADGAGPDQLDPYALYAHCLIELDRLADAEAALQEAIGRNRRIRGTYLSSNLVAKARLYLLDGRWDDALAECSASTAAPDVLGFAPVARNIVTLIGIHRGTGNPDTTPPSDGRLGGIGYAHFRPWIDALLHEARGHPDLALKLLVDAQHRLADGLAAATLHYIFPDIARLAAEVGDTDAARSVAANADELLARHPTASRTGTALLCRGLADRDPDRLAAAAEAFRQAGRPLFEAQVYENTAVVLAAASREADARAALGTATGLYNRLGASWDTARAVARVRPYGIRLGVRGPRNRPKTGWAALTDTERKVAVLVTEGCTNSEIAAHMYLSRRTIQSHVSSILAKLDLRSRHEIAAGLPPTR